MLSFRFYCACFLFSFCFVVLLSCRNYRYHTPLGAPNMRCLVHNCLWNYIHESIAWPRLLAGTLCCELDAPLGILCNSNKRLALAIEHKPYMPSTPSRTRATSGLCGGRFSGTSGSTIAQGTKSPSPYTNHMTCDHTTATLSPESNSKSVYLGSMKGDITERLHHARDDGGAVVLDIARVHETLARVNTATACRPTGKSLLTAGACASRGRIST
jgi:hypothetical protein